MGKKKDNIEGRKIEPLKTLKPEETVTLHESNFQLKLGENFNYDVLVDLKTLQGAKFPYFNATEIVKQYNEEVAFQNEIVGDLETAYAVSKKYKKRLSDFLKRQRTKDLLANLETAYAVSKNRLIITKIGKNAETWIHKELFLSMMIWLDAEHELAVTQFVNRVVERIDGAKLIRSTAKKSVFETMDEVKVVREMLLEEGSKAAPEYYATVNRQMYKSATGKSLPKGGIDHDDLLDVEEANMITMRTLVKELILEKLAEGLTGKNIKFAINNLTHSIDLAPKALT